MASFSPVRTAMGLGSPAAQGRSIRRTLGFLENPKLLALKCGFSNILRILWLRQLSGRIAATEDSFVGPLAAGIANRASSRPLRASQQQLS